MQIAHRQRLIQRNIYRTSILLSPFGKGFFWPVPSSPWLKPPHRGLVVRVLSPRDASAIIPSWWVWKRDVGNNDGRLEKIDQEKRRKSTERNVIRKWIWIRSREERNQKRSEMNSILPFKGSQSRPRVTRVVWISMLISVIITTSYW